MIPSDFELVTACQASYVPDAVPYFQPEGFTDRLFLTETDDFAVIAIEGTFDVAGWIGDFLALGVREQPTTSAPGLSFLHVDFFEAAQRLLLSVKEVAQRKPLALTGHSRGAALTAILAALLIQDGLKPIRVGLFAPPRAGGSDLIALVSSVSTVAYKNGDDPVVETPFTLMPSFPYEQFVLTKIGKTLPNALDCHHIENYVAAIKDGPLPT